MSLVPMVIKKGSDGSERGMDIYSRLLDDRIVFCTGMIDQEMASSIVAQLLYLEAEDPNKPISLYVSGPGGEVSAGFSIISTMNLIKCPVSTIIHGTVASMSTVIAASGEKYLEKGMNRFYKFINEKVFNHLAKCTNTTITKLKKDCDRDFWMNENEWKKYGGCDKVIDKR